MKRTDQRIVNVSYPTPFAVWGKDLQTTDGLAPENGHAASVWDNACCRAIVFCWEYGIPVWPFIQTFFDFSSSSSVRL